MRQRRRLGVALVLDRRTGAEVDGMRRALGDSTVGMVPPHLTLVPPVNVGNASLGDALLQLRRAAALQAEPLSLVFGPLESFAPLSPVLYLALHQSEPSQLDRLARLREGLLVPPLDPPPRWPWAPHVTVCDEASEDMVPTAMRALSTYSTEAVLDRVVLLEQLGRGWSPLADVFFGAPAVIGRGGLDLEVTRSMLAGPDALALLEAGMNPDEPGPPPGEPPAAGPCSTATGPPPEVVQALISPLVDGFGPEAARGAHEVAHRIVLTGRREGTCIGLATAWASGAPGARAQVGAYVLPASRGRGVGRALLAALEAAMREQGWELAGAQAHGPEEFFAHCCSWAR